MAFRRNRQCGANAPAKIQIDQHPIPSRTEPLRHGQKPPRTDRRGDNPGNIQPDTYADSLYKTFLPRPESIEKRVLPVFRQSIPKTAFDFGKTATIGPLVPLFDVHAYTIVQTYRYHHFIARMG